MIYDRKRFVRFVLFSLGIGNAPDGITKEEWIWFYNESVRQAILGLTYEGIRINRTQGLPKELSEKWSGEREKIVSANRIIIDACIGLTEFFCKAGYRSVILKGASKAILYPNPEARTPGDIDIWLEGGKGKVMDFIDRQGMIGKPSYHHFHTTAEIIGYPELLMEIHYRPSSGCFNPIKNRIIQRFLESEIQDSKLHKTEKGHFNTPSELFAVIAELIHVRRHFVAGGIGLRHMLDLYMLLIQYPLTYRGKLLKRLGLLRFTGAVSYVMCECLGLENKEYFPIPSDKRSGKKLWDEIFLGGNFGRYAPRQEHGFFVRCAMREWRTLRLLRVDPSEFGWWELHLWWAFTKTLPERIRKRKLSLRNE